MYHFMLTNNLLQHKSLNTCRYSHFFRMMPFFDATICNIGYATCTHTSENVCTDIVKKSEHDTRMKIESKQDHSAYLELY